MKLTKEQQAQFDKDSERVFDCYDMAYGRHGLSAFWKHLDENPTWTVAELLAWLNSDEEEEDDE